MNYSILIYDARMRDLLYKYASIRVEVYRGYMEPPNLLGSDATTSDDASAAGSAFEHRVNHPDAPAAKRPRRQSEPERGKIEPQQHEQCDDSSLGALLRWLRDEGAEGLENLEFRESSIACGGLGAFARKPIAPNGLIAKIPQKCVLNSDKALASDIGRACVAANPNCTDEFVLILWLAIGRVDPSHPFHIYISSLPPEPISPLAWDKSLVDGPSQLGRTNLGRAILSHQEMITVEYAALLQSLKKMFPSMVPQACNTDLLAWAHDMYVSRRFPAELGMFAIDSTDGVGENTSAGKGEPETRLASADASEGAQPKPSSHLPPRRPLQHTCSRFTESLGIMLPVFDILNHKYNQDIVWSGDESGVSFRNGSSVSSGISKHSEIFNNYGNKSNESLMMAHGFSLYNNLHDSYGLKLLMRDSSDPDGKPVCLGVFHLLRAENPDVVSGHDEQIPSSLWRAITNAQEFSPSPSRVNSLATEPAPISIGVEDVELLSKTVQSRLQPFAATKSADIALSAANFEKSQEHVSMDDMRRIFISRYRDGQRRVLEDALQTLSQMISSAD